MIVAAISVFSELIMTVTILYALPMLGGLPHKIKPVNLVLALTFVLVVSTAFDITFYFQNSVLQFIFLVLNYFKFAAAAIISYKRCSIKIICLTFILHTICAVCEIGISPVVPTNQYSTIFSSEPALLIIRSIFLLLIILFKKRSEKNYRNSVLAILPSYIYVLVLINIFLADGLLEAANFETTDTSTKDITIKVLALLLSICVFATLIALVSGVWSKKYYSDINAILERQVETQIKYYENREKTYTAIRRFKHDYINHINCIRSMLRSERYSQAAEYLSGISDMFPTDNFLFDTGNFVSDAILSDKQESVKDENIVIKFSGDVPVSINGTDLCIILGNALDNAIEASRAVDGEKTIHICGGFRHGYFILTISNPTVNAVGNTIPHTTKDDKSEHGFGLLNIKNVVDKYDGYMKIENKDNIFTLSLTFNSIAAETISS